MIRHITGVSCPSCGTTRSMISFLNGNIREALYWNPLGILTSLFMVLIPLGILHDYWRKKNSIYEFYLKAEEKLKQRKFYIPAVLLIIVNWGWNIYKDL
jgi:hypothetical protein